MLEGTRDAIVISGLGAVSAVGVGVPAIRRALLDGGGGLRPMRRIDMAPFRPVHLAGEVEVEPATADDWAVLAAREAWQDAGAEALGVAPERVAVVAGTTEGERGDVTSVAAAVRAALGIRGPAWTISTACASSTNAIGLGRDLLLDGDADLVVAGGAERLLPEMFAGFLALGVLSEGPCAPFGETLGTSLGEGAAFVVLERASLRPGRASPNGAPRFVLGYGLSGDAWHETTPEPRGEGVARATLAALADAGLRAADVDYVNAHATGTATNDDAEWRGLVRALGDRARAIPVSGQKGIFGHAQGAAGALETIATACAWAEGRVPPSVRVGRGRPRGPDDPVAGEVARLHDAEVILKASAAFGGANAVLALGRSERRTPEPVIRRVRVAGAAELVVARGQLRDEATLDAGLGSLGEVLRKSDPSCRMLTLAASRALALSGLRVRGALRDRAGIFVGATRVSPATILEMQRSIERSGLGRASAAAFSRMVLGAPAGAASRALSLRGPTTTVAGSGAAGLLSIALAARALASRRDADLVVAGGLDERAEGEDGEEGAACVVLCTDQARPEAAQPSELDAGAAVEIASVAIAGDLETAKARALAAAHAARAVECSSVGPGSLGSARAFVAALAVAAEEPVIVTAAGPLGAVAIVLRPGRC